MKFLSEGGITERLLSLPVRGAWIEIISYMGMDQKTKVAPRKGSVD